VIAYRFASYATPVRTIADSRPARFHRGGEPEPTQYLSLHPLGPMAELMRSNDLRAPEQLAATRVRTWALEAAIDELDEINFDNAERWGISAAELVADDQSACRALADGLRTNDVHGVIVPSAALPGTRNVVLFGPRVAAPYLTTAVSPVDIPASITSEGGRPPTSMTDVVRFIGDPHSALEAWSHGDDFEFVEPDWALT
jgi:RES domain-containing protein